MSGDKLKAKAAALWKTLRAKGNLTTVAVVVAFLAVAVYLLCNLGSCTSGGKVTSSLWKTSSSTDQLGDILSNIEGAGATDVLVTYDAAGQLVGVIVVAEGGGNQQVVVKLLRAVQTATGATLEQIDIFERKQEKE